MTVKIHDRKFRVKISLILIVNLRIAIRKIRPTLNQDDGRYHLSKMYDKLIRSSDVMTFPRQGTKGAMKLETSPLKL